MTPIALITDFGTTDWYVGAMKGAIAAIAPDTPIIDITHDILPADIRHASYILSAAHTAFPRRTVFCVVVDPGVGGSRKCIAVKTDDYIFIGPDNGVLSWICQSAEKCEVRSIENESLYRKESSATFHGRDIFGPVAAYCAAGFPFKKIGPVTTDFVIRPLPQAVVKEGSITAPILSIDRFGNIITAIRQDTFEQKDTTEFQFTVRKQRFRCGMKTHFEEVAAGEPLCYIGSSGFIEIALNRGNAAQYFGVTTEDSIEMLLP